MPSPSTPNSAIDDDISTGAVGSLSAPAVLAAAASTESRQNRPKPASVTAALLDQERQAKQARQPICLDDLVGLWQLQFTAPKKPTYKSNQLTANGFYIPAVAKATLGFAEDTQRPTGVSIQNQLQVLNVKLRFTGPAKLLPKKNVLAFNFDRLELMLGGLTLVSIPINAAKETVQDFATTPVGKLPFFAFFSAQDRYLAARGRGGGLALWTKIG